ncbi:GNAT family N-acetyltransferase [Pleomorphovibrio marinus]|uniref:GNAT family N-acetyltransferase n=1 Tax=Pleomorphovibrio marinus TaxID=2164132 RepID=UPI000E0A666A|nr:GNAT family N-acetyltransferase [Pleomorphovibrio marinus]
MVVIRKAEFADIPVIQRIAFKTWPETFGDILSRPQLSYMLDLMYSENSLCQQIREKGHEFVISGSEGFASFEMNYKDSSSTKIHKIYILPTAQGRGVGKALFGHIAAMAKECSNDKLTLNVNKFNLSAISFYEKQGFMEVGREDLPIGSGYWMEDIIMEKAI